MILFKQIYNLLLKGVATSLAQEVLVVNFNKNMILFIITQVFAADYFLSNSGDNGNDGRTISTPFQTLERVN